MSPCPLMKLIYGGYCSSKKFGYDLPDRFILNSLHQNVIKYNLILFLLIQYIFNIFSRNASLKHLKSIQLILKGQD